VFPLPAVDKSCGPHPESNVSFGAILTVAHVDLGAVTGARTVRDISKRNAPLKLKATERTECGEWRGLLTDRKLLNRG
jgi:hypothetical protein